MHGPDPIFGRRRRLAAHFAEQHAAATSGCIQLSTCTGLCAHTSRRYDHRQVKLQIHISAGVLTNTERTRHADAGSSRTRSGLVSATCAPAHVFFRAVRLCKASGITFAQRNAQRNQRLATVVPCTHPAHAPGVQMWAPPAQVKTCMSYER